MVFDYINIIILLSNFTAWASAEPDGGNCGAVYSGDWYDVPCTNNHMYACEIEGKTIQINAKSGNMAFRIRQYIANLGNTKS